MSKHHARNDQPADEPISSGNKAGTNEAVCPDSQAAPERQNNGPSPKCSGSSNSPSQEGEGVPDLREKSSDQGGGSGEKAPDEMVKTLEAKLAEANDQYLRKAAEFENFRKRINREKQEAIDFANQGLLLDLIQIIDDFDRAIKSAGSYAENTGETGADTSQKPQADFVGLYEGIAMIEKRLISQLENKWGLKRFDSAGEVFDPNRHEAIMMEKSPKVSEPVVQEDFLKGYTLKDRVIRSAKVKVLMPENPRETAPGTPGTEKTEKGDAESSSLLEEEKSGA
jgi:molecular chaperone GrpE